MSADNANAGTVSATVINELAIAFSKVLPEVSAKKIADAVSLGMDTSTFGSLGPPGLS